MNKKKLLSLSLVVIMIAILSFSSLAWFTDTGSVKNDFSIAGAGENDADKIFSMDVLEKGEDGKITDEGLKFEDILPGDHHVKEAYVTNTGSYNQYIRVIMTITDWEQIKKTVTINMDDDFAANWKIDTTETPGVSVDANGILKTTKSVVLVDGNLVVPMYLTRQLEPTETVEIMDYVDISKDATQEDFIDPAFKDGFQITFKADAAQTENILDPYGKTEWKNAQATFKALETTTP